jgi:simple sugar transport system ATP-binding protein
VSLLELRGVSKSFGPVAALRDVDLHINHAEALGLIGDNGAGKSTLIKLLSGVYGPSAGSILLEGKEFRASSPLDARRAGIEMIYQDLALCDDLDVAANVFLGREVRRRVGPFTILNRKAMAQYAAGILADLGASIAPERVAGALSGGERQLVAVARALQFEPRLFLLDEPTAALANDKIRVLLELIERLKTRGVSVLLISHRFSDILRVCDRVVVLRQGSVAGEVVPTAQPPEQTMALMEEFMSGSSLVAA